VIGIVVAVRAWKDENAEFHGSRLAGSTRGRAICLLTILNGHHPGNCIVSTHADRTMSVDEEGAAFTRAQSIGMAARAGSKIRTGPGTLKCNVGNRAESFSGPRHPMRRAGRRLRPLRRECRYNRDEEESYGSFLYLLWRRHHVEISYLSGLRRAQSWEQGTVVRRRHPGRTRSAFAGHSSNREPRGFRAGR
jgi:hypothetical protein